jgi:hypothetical protein
MNELDDLLTQWTAATADLKFGVQRVFHDTFVLAAEGKTTLIHGADYRDGNPCLVNTVGTMLTTGGGSGIPSAHFGEVVSLFDRINSEFDNNGVNTDHGHVSSLAAEIFVRHFAPLKEAPEPKTTLAEDVAKQQYHEPTDEDMAHDMVMLMRGDLPPCGEVNYTTEKSSEFDGAAVVKPESRANS